ncbi:hypothetical protein TWF281_003233 [Arthrobotrys megalospora]
MAGQLEGTVKPRRQYSIVIRNQSGVVQNYLVFHEHPYQAKDDPTVHSTVWQRSPGVFSPNGQVKFMLSDQIFAVCGTTTNRKELELKAQIDTIDHMEVALGTDTTPGTDANMVFLNNGVGFKGPPGTISKPGAFAITTGHFDGDTNENIWCGLGKYDQYVEKTIFEAISEIDSTTADGDIATITHKSDGTYTAPVFTWQKIRFHEQTAATDIVENND